MTEIIEKDDNFVCTTCILFGRTGSGKSSIINMLKGEGPLISGLESTTLSLDKEIIEIKDKKILLLDTAGFGDTRHVADQNIINSLIDINCKSILYCIPCTEKFTNDIAINIVEICCYYEMNVNNVILVITKCDGISKKNRDKQIEIINGTITKYFGNISRVFTGESDDMLDNLKNKILETSEARIFKPINNYFSIYLLFKRKEEIFENTITVQKNKEKNQEKNF